MCQDQLEVQGTDLHPIYRQMKAISQPGHFFLFRVSLNWQTGVGPV